jgi:hypothetical protein
MYREVGNGGFGQSFAVLSLEALFVVHTRQGKRYLEALGDDPVGLPYVVICHWGCSVYSCIDCSSPFYPVLRYDAVGGVFIPEQPSFDAWVAAWVQGANIWDTVMDEERYNTFVTILTATQTLPTPLLLALAEWIDALVIAQS